MPPSDTAQRRQTLSRDRVLDGAMRLADEIGIEAFTIRKLADVLDSKPMTIYHHIPNKEAIIDGMVDRVFSEIDLPPTDVGWKQAMRQRMMSAREALARHPWAPPLMESRTNPGPATLAHHDAVLGCLLNAGFSLEMTGHAYAVLDSYLYGFAMQEANLPATAGEDLAELAETIIAPMAEHYPHLARYTVERVMQPGYDFGAEFEYGLDLLLDGLEQQA